MNELRGKARFTLNVPNLLIGIIVGGFAVFIWFTIDFGNRGTNDQDDDSRRNRTLSSGVPSSSQFQQLVLANGFEIKSVESITELLSLYSKEFDRNLALYFKVGQAEANVIRKLLTDTAMLEVPKQEADWLQHAQQVMMGRLVALDVDSAIEILNTFDLRTQQPLVFKILNVWSTTNLESALKFASNLDLSLKHHAIQGIAEAYQDFNSTELINIGRRIGTENLVQDVIQTIVYKNESINPEVAWKNLTRDASQMTFSNFDRIQNIANAWVQESGVDVLRVMLKSIADPDLRRTLLLTNLRQVSQNNPQSAFDFAMSLPDYDITDYLDSVMFVWSRNDPEEAWTMLEQVDDNSVRLQLQQTLIEGWASKSPSSLLAAVTGFPKGIRDNARLQAIRVISISSPLEAISTLSQIEDEDYYTTEAIVSIGQSWARLDSNAAINWFFSNEGQVSNDPGAILRFLRGLGEVDPQQAFDTALDLDANLGITLQDEPISLEGLLLMNLVDQDLELVIELVPRVRDAPSKLAALRVIANQLAQESRHEQALQLGQNLAEEEQDRYYFWWGTNSWTTGKANDVLGLLQQIPSSSARSKAAFGIRLQNRFFDKLSNQQLSVVNAYMTESDLIELEELLKSK